MHPDTSCLREDLAVDLESVHHRLHQLRTHRAIVAADPELDARLGDVQGELAELVQELAPDLNLAPLDAARCVPETWAHELRLGKVEGVSVLRRRHIDGRASGLFALPARRCGLVMMLDDGGVGWQPPELGPLQDPASPAVTTDELTGFVVRTQQLLAFLLAEQARREHG